MFLNGSIIKIVNLQSNSVLQSCFPNYYTMKIWKIGRGQAMTGRGQAMTGMEILKSDKRICHLF